MDKFFTLTSAYHRNFILRPRDLLLKVTKHHLPKGNLNCMRKIFQCEKDYRLDLNLNKKYVGFGHPIGNGQITNFKKFLSLLNLLMKTYETS